MLDRRTSMFHDMTLWASQPVNVATYCSRRGKRISVFLSKLKLRNLECFSLVAINTVFAVCVPRPDITLRPSMLGHASNSLTRNFFIIPLTGICVYVIMLIPLVTVTKWMHVVGQ